MVTAKQLGGSLGRQAPRDVRRAVRGLQAAADRTWLALQLRPTLYRIRAYTMASDESLEGLARVVRRTLTERIPGDLVECGVWRGGASFLMADLLRRAGAPDRRVWMFDSFEGLPPPAPIDGRSAAAYASDPASPRYFDNCRASFEEAVTASRQLGLAPFTRVVKGWFEDSLPVAKRDVGPIALLRIDADWYASVRTCLEQLYDQVSPGGFVLFDDYYTWDGCAIAVHEFLGKRQLAHRLRQEGDALFRKL